MIDRYKGLDLDHVYPVIQSSIFIAVIYFQARISDKEARLEEMALDYRFDAGMSYSGGGRGGLSMVST